MKRFRVERRKKIVCQFVNSDAKRGKGFIELEGNQFQVFNFYDAKFFFSFFSSRLKAEPREGKKFNETFT